MWAWEEIIDSEVWTFVETGPACAVIPVKRQNGQVLITLLREERLSGKKEIKTIGGFCKEGEGTWAAATRILREETEIKMETGSKLKSLTKMIGYDTIRTPIEIVIVTGFAEYAHRVKIETIKISLEEAKDIALGCTKEKVNDETTRTAILMLWILEKEGGLDWID